MNHYLNQYFDKIHGGCLSIDEKNFIKASNLVARAKVEGKKVLIVGNGGSAAMASHVTVDLVKVAGVRAVNFNEADLITCFANDYGYENWVSQAIESYGDVDDVLIAISSSGMSKNIINAVRKAGELGIKTITLSGFNPDNRLRGIGDVNFWVDSSEYNTVEMVHHIWLLAMVDSLVLGKGNA